MTLASVQEVLIPLTGTRLFDRVAEHGSSAHPYLSHPELVQGPNSSKNLADAVHFLCTIHGRYPGLMDYAARRITDPAATAWFSGVQNAFRTERTFLARLTVEVGPLPSTPGSAGAEAALLSQRHALDMIGQSERNGCALGAAMALVIDWSHIRRILNAAGNKFGVEPPAFNMGNTTEIRDLADELGSTPLVERALLFGAQQVMLQQYGLWDLLEARQMARNAR